MENPYPKIDHPDSELPCHICEGHREAWDEDSASRDAEVSEHHIVIQNLRDALIAEHKKLGKQAEIVSELVEAVESALPFLTAAGNMVNTIPTFQMAGPKDYLSNMAAKLERAIAGAKGE